MNCSSYLRRQNLFRLISIKAPENTTRSHNIALMLSFIMTTLTNAPLTNILSIIAGVLGNYLALSFEDEQAWTHAKMYLEMDCWF